MIKYGLISDTDARTIEKTIDFIIRDGDYLPLRITEIGLYNCETSNGIYEYLQTEKNLLDNDIVYTGIDNNKDKLIENIPEWMYFINGNSTEVYNQLVDNSQDLIFIDGDHSFIGVISDFFAYADKVKVGGFLAFHDTGKHIKPFKDFQHGDKDNPDAYISARKALEKIGLLWEEGTDLFIDRYAEEWELIFDEADETNEAGGICVFRKLY